MGEGVGVFRNWDTTHFVTLMVSLGMLIKPVGVPFSLLMCYNESTPRLKA